MSDGYSFQIVICIIKINISLICLFALLIVSRSTQFCSNQTLSAIFPLLVSYTFCLTFSCSLLMNCVVNRHSFLPILQLNDFYDDDLEKYYFLDPRKVEE